MGGREAFSAACLSAFPANLAAAVFFFFKERRGEKWGEGGERGGEEGQCDLACVETPGLSPRPLPPRPAALSGSARVGQITAKTEGLGTVRWGDEREGQKERKTNGQTQGETDQRKDRTVSGQRMLWFL